ncbi:MAG: EAL domain-containing protein [Tatlockia sp.]|nr:EAL domain-containing protein [Tatlockia sp.]
MNKKILLVDDEPQILRVLKALFIKNGYKVFTASTADEALILLATTPVQVIISDYRMPKGTGAELLSKVKEFYPEIIRLIMSGYADFDVIEKSINEGSIFKFISKPWDNNSLLKTVEDALIYYADKNPSKCIISEGILVCDNDLELALDEDQFLIYYQPIIAMNTNQIVGAEALLRWQHPEKGLLFPSQFIKLCEDTKLIIPIGLAALKKACQQLKRWHQEGFTALNVAVNLSASQFNHPGLVDRIKDIILETKIPPQNLDLEITESVLIQNGQNILQDLLELKKLGIKLSLDDFGTGYSSLSYLSKFPINSLKIDKSFIQEIATNSKTLEIVTMTINLAKTLNLVTIAEGVETQLELELLKKMHCDLVQGYLFSKPVPDEEFHQLLNQ